MKRKVEIKPAAGSRATGQNIEARLISAATSKQIRKKKDPSCNKLLLCGTNVVDCPVLRICGDHLGDCPNLWFRDASRTRKLQKQT